ncbi:MAG TPA: hypothetical protein VN702_09560, partial [Acetobacteraceae bacterium]|nr:hypothetical protein [Acetobacteraceae bacterium]
MSWYRAIPFIAAGGAFMFFAALRLSGSTGAYTAILHGLGVPVFRFPFLDTHAIVAAIQCHSAGIDVYATNPCDVLGRPHVYSPLWLRADVLPVTARWTPYVGLAFGGLFLTSLTLLPQVRGRTGAVIMILASVSPSVLFAMERGNNDLLVFAMAAATASFCLRGVWGRNAGYALATLAAALKFYPVLLLILVLRERTVRCVIALAACGGLLAAALLLDLHEVLRALQLTPHGGPFVIAFGARNLPLGAAAIFGWSNSGAGVLEAALVGTVIALAFAGAKMVGPAVTQLDARETAFLMAGAVLLVGCFFLAQNVDYRAIHLLLVLPALIRLSDPRSRSGRLAACTCAVAVLLLWEDAVRMSAGPYAGA